MVTIDDPLVYNMRPWEYNVEPDFINEMGVEFYILEDPTLYLKVDLKDGEIIPILEDSILIRARNPRTGDTDIFLKFNDDEWRLLDDQESCESLYLYLDVLKLSYMMGIQ